MERRGAPAVVGGLGTGATAAVDDAGVVVDPQRGRTLGFWLGVDGAWLDPAELSGRRQRLAAPAPVVETSVPVPSGEALHRVYGVASPPGLVVVEIENRSPGPLSVALVLRPTAVKRKGEIGVAGSVVTVGRRPALVLPRAPLRWAVGDDPSGGARRAVLGGEASDGPFVATRSKRLLEAAFVYPVPHRTTLRAALVTRPLDGAARVDVGALPDVGEVARGWTAVLGSGMRTELPDPVQEGVDAARAALLLASGRAKPSPELVVALEDWGFDDEAAAAWARSGVRARRRASRRAAVPSSAWARAATHLAAASPARAFPGGPAAFLAAVRDLLLVDAGTHVELAPGFPSSWLGADVALHDAPTRAGRVSFALRWHGPRPALLWEAPDGLRCTAPALDPSWSATGGAGEALLAAPEPTLLSMGPQPDRNGDAVDDPGSFS